jgi:hypothetical protein
MGLSLCTFDSSGISFLRQAMAQRFRHDSFIYYSCLFVINYENIEIPKYVYLQFICTVLNAIIVTSFGGSKRLQKRGWIVLHGQKSPCTYIIFHFLHLPAYHIRLLTIQHVNCFSSVPSMWLNFVLIPLNQWHVDRIPSEEISMWLTLKDF